MILENTNPGAEGAGAAEIVVLGGATAAENTLTHVELQAFRLRRRFIMSKPLAMVVCEHAFANGGRA